MPKGIPHLYYSPDSYLVAKMRIGFWFWAMTSFAKANFKSEGINEGRKFLMRAIFCRKKNLKDGFEYLGVGRS